MVSTLVYTNPGSKLNVTISREIHTIFLVQEQINTVIRCLEPASCNIVARAYITCVVICFIRQYCRRWPRGMAVALYTDKVDENC